LYKPAKHYERNRRKERASGDKGGKFADTLAVAAETVIGVQSVDAS
jgi:hypothetical protein